MLMREKSFLKGALCILRTLVNRGNWGLKWSIKTLPCAGILIFQPTFIWGNGQQKGFLKKWFVDVKTMDAESWQILQKLKVDASSVKLKVESLSGGRQQSVAIGRVISFDPRVIILDEPTANLSVTATKQVLDLMLELKSTHDVSMIIISHRLQDIFAVGDRVIVLKRGRKVGERIIRDTHEDDLLSMIVQGDDYERSRQD